MNHDFDEEVKGSAEKRSRRNPRFRDGEPVSSRPVRRKDGDDGLNVMGDSRVRPLPRQSEKSQNMSRETASRRQTARQAAENPESSRRSTRQTAEYEDISRRSAARQTAAASSYGTGRNGRTEEKLAKRKRRRRMIAMIVAECFALVFIFTYGYFARRINEIQRPQFDEKAVENTNIDVSTLEKMKGYWTIAVFGVDARDRAIAKGTNADVNMICNINLDTGEIKLVSVFRDTYLNISENGSYNKLNQAYFLGGPEQAVAALNRNLDLNIQSYVTFNWKAVADAINILGGVDIELSKAEFYYINSFITETVKATGVGSTQLSHAGMNHLDGVQAVAYGRLRLMDTDYARTERQRKVVQQAFEKAKKADLSTLNTLIGAVFPQVATNIGVDDMVKNASIISKFYIGETTGFPQARGDANLHKKGLVVVPQTLESNVVQLHQFLFGEEDYQPSDTVKRLSAKIAEDTGMYKEGKYVDKVGTEGGVIQPPKTTAAETKATEETEETKETKESGEIQTDENGEPIETREPETDEDGNPIETDESETDESETDEVETVRPGGETGERPTGSDESSASRPLRPDGSTESSAARPTSPAAGGPSRPDTTESSAVRPGDSSSQAPTGSLEGPSGSGNNGSATQIPQFPGSSDTEVGGPAGSGNDSITGNSSPGGVVAAPGM